MPFQVEELSISVSRGVGAADAAHQATGQRFGESAAARGELDRSQRGEAALSDPGNKRARLFTAAGSAGETQHALRQAVAWRLVTAREAEAAMRLVRRIVAILWRMTRG